MELFIESVLGRETMGKHRKAVLRLLSVNYFADFREVVHVACSDNQGSLADQKWQGALLPSRPLHPLADIFASFTVFC